MMHNEATTLIVALFIGNCVASPSLKAQFQFALPGNQSATNNKEVTTKSAFSRQCFHFIYAVAPSDLDLKMGTNIKEKVKAQCIVTSKDQCDAWSSKLTDLFAAKNKLKSKHLRTQPKNGLTYTQWCAELFTAATNPAQANAKQVQDVSKATKPHAVSKEPKATPKTSVPRKRGSPTSGQALVSQHTEVTGNSPTKSTNASSKATAITPKAAHDKKATPPQNMTKQASTEAKVDPNLCACVHRDGKKLCHCRKMHSHSKPAAESVNSTAPHKSTINTSANTTVPTKKLAPVPATAAGKRSSVPTKARSTKGSTTAARQAAARDSKSVGTNAVKSAAQKASKAATNGASANHSANTVAKKASTTTSTTTQGTTTHKSTTTTSTTKTTTTTTTTTMATTTIKTTTTKWTEIDDVAAQSELVPGLQNLQGAESMLNGVLAAADKE